MNIQMVQVVLDQYGLREVAGEADNPGIMEMAKECGFTHYKHDEIAWCSLLMNWAAFKTGYQRSNSLAARSWLGIGEPTETPQMGDIVVFWRISPDGPYGHVGLYIGTRNGLIYVLAGNQGNEVSIVGFTTEKLLGYRRLSLLAA